MLTCSYFDDYQRFLLFKTIYFHVFYEIVMLLHDGDITMTGLPELFDSLYQIIVLLPVCCDKPCR